FKAIEHNMLLIGKRAAVQRDSALLVGDTITFNDSTQVITALGDTVTLRDPAQGPDDVVALGSVKYNVPERRGVMRNVTTAVESGQRWILHGDVAAFRGDTTDAGRAAIYAKNGWLTSCEEIEPHYHFAAKEMKLITKNIMIVRPAILYIADVPVMWLPFVFNDMRPGRRSGLLSPRIGFNQVFRSSPFLRRTIDDIGYYFAINDYVSTQLTLDWRSDARGTDIDPGYVKLNSLFDYRWKDRFIDGQLGISSHHLRNGQVNRQYSVRHSQKFSERTAFTANFNYVSNTQIQRQTTFNPVQALQTISSSMTFRTGRGPFAIDLGGTQKQYPGRDQLDRDFPSLRISSKPIEVGEWLTWTPSLAITNAQSFDIDQVGDFAYRYIDRGAGVLDSVQLKRDTRSSSVAFETPIEVFGFNWRNSVRVTDVANEFPERRTIYPNPRDTTVKQDRVFARTYRTGLEWETSFNLPNFSQGKWNISPSVSIQKVDGRSPLVVRTERTGGTFVAQGLRPSAGISMSPKLYGFFPGFGPVQRIRHALEPNLSWQYTPRGKVSDAFLAANGDVAVGFLGNNPQNMLSLGLTSSFEAKLKAREQPVTDDSTRALSTQPEEGQKVKLLSLTFTTLSYDFVRARESSGGTGLTNRSFDWSARSDLLPGFDVGVNYSLFQGDPISDTAVFKPYREGVRASLALDGNSPIVRGLARLFGISMADRAERERQRGVPTREQQQEQDSRDRGFGGNRDLLAARPIAGSAYTASLQVPSGQGWRMNLAYTGSRQRPPVGDNVKDYDPRSQCDRYKDDFFQQSLCLNQFATGGIPTTGLPFNETTRGATLYRMPPQANLNGSISFHVTDKWAAQWQTSYDFQTKEFAQHVVSLQRELHDWDAIFAFTRSPNGNFSFNFFIALKAQPDIKLDYDRPSFPRGYTGRRSQ
ncbi:MAG: putative LPS assembly protein LptD, partial [Gemmatimonadaceae bacterium]